MKTLIYNFSRKSFRLKDIPVPSPKSGEVLIKIKASALCGTDLHIMEGPLKGKAYDKKEIVLGHSFSGIVHGLGRGVKKFKKGQKVFGSNFVWCEKCSGCVRREESTCDDRYIFGMEAPGSHAEFISVPQRAVFHLSKNISFEEGSLICDLLALVCHTVRAAAIGKGQRVLIFGAGPVGLALSMVLKGRGLKRVVLVEPKSFRRRLARKLTGFQTINSQKVAAGKTDVVFETSGQDSALRLSYKSLRRGGKLVMIGIPQRNFDLPAVKWISRQLTLIGIFNFDIQDIRTALKWVPKLDLKKIITHRFPLKSGGRAYRLMKQGQSGRIMLWI